MVRSTLSRPLRIIAAISAIASVAAVAGCADSGSQVPEGLSVSVYQPRPDVAAGRIAIQVHNDSDRELTIESAELTSSSFLDDLVWASDRESRISPGRAVDLRVPLGDAECDESTVARHTVTLEYRWIGDSESRTTAIVPTDPFGVLTALHDAACLGERIAQVATLTAESIDSSGLPGDAATLTIRVEPTGEPGEYTIDAVTSTTLLAPTKDGVATPEAELGITVDADGPPEFILLLVPNRCDVHALAEDKVGTLIPLQVTAPDGTRGRLVLSSSDDLRREMYAFYSSYCALG